MRGIEHDAGVGRSGLELGAAGAHGEQIHRPLARLTSKEYAAELRKTIDPDHTAKSSPTTFEWPHESEETTHLSVVDADRNAVAMTYTLARIVAIHDNDAGYCVFEKEPGG